MREMNLRLTLMDSAQAFHWRKIGGVFAAVVDGRVLTSADEDAFARAYVDDARDYSRLMEDCASYPVAARAVQATPGLRVLNQPPWEALLQFILSANNNVARIRALVTALNETYGEAHAFQGETLHGFPKPEVLANLTEAELRARVTCGYRAAYLIGTARMVADGFPLNALSAMPIERAREELMRLPGVGPKVADCALLFGCRHADAFPVDVWVKRLMADWFGVTGSPAFLAREARRMFGERCGLVQQSLFHAARVGLIETGGKTA